MPTGTLFQTTGRIVRGAGCLARVPQEIARLRRKRAMIITDPGIVATGMIARLIVLLEQGGIAVSLFDAVEPDPRLQLASLAAEQLRASGSDLVIGIGGGSAIDIAKVAAVLVTNNQPIATLFGIDLVPQPGLPLLVIPTTAGTGSEVTPIAILSDEEEKLKKGIVSPYLFPTVALLDPELTVGLPPMVTAATGMDALIHAMEAYTSKNADRLSDLFACQAMRLLYDNIRKAYNDGGDIAARGDMLEGSMLAGIAFANAGVTAVHAFAYPIGAEFHIPHGIANSLMLVPVMEFNMVAGPQRFADIAAIFGEDVAGLSAPEAARRAMEAIRRLTVDLNLPRKLSQYGVKDSDVDNLAAGVMKVTRLLANNPRELTVEDAKAIYRQVL